MGGKSSIKNYIKTIRYYLKKEEIEEPLALSQVDNPDDTETFTSPSTGMEFILIPAGEFNLGSPPEEKERFDSESPVHKVKINTSFYLGKSAVTQKQWKKIMGDNLSHFKGEDRPVEMVTWKEVQEFVAKMNEMEGTDKYRLPSEAEWEYACRAGAQTSYFFGEDKSKLKEYAWYAGNSGSKTHPIGQKKPNPWGLYDMHGNIWEWVQDEWHEDYNGSPSNGNAWEEGNILDRVSRGGSWYCNTELCRSACRFRRKPDSRFGNLGFRMLREL